MAMTITLYNYSGAYRMVDKSSGLLGGTTLQGDQLDIGQSLSDLSIVIHSTTAPNYNYCYIADLHRYYFIRQIAWLGGTAFQLDLHVDVLYTYKSKYTSMNALIEYSTSGSALEYDPRMNYVDVPVVTRTLGLLYPNFLLDQTQTNIYTAEPMVMIRYYQMPIHTTVQDGFHDNDTVIECAIMPAASFNQFIYYFLNAQNHTEEERVEFGSKIIDVTNVYYINSYRLSQATTPVQAITIRTPHKPAGITFSIADSGANYIYILNTPADVGAIGYSLVAGGTVANATFWDVNGNYTTKLPYIGEITIVPSKMGISAATSLYYAVAIDPYNAQYIITPTDKADGTGTWYFENEQRVQIKTSNAFPIDTSVDNGLIRKIQTCINGTTNVLTNIVDGGGLLPIASNIFGGTEQWRSIDASEAAHYKYNGEFNGAAEWTPVDTKRLVNTSVIVPPDTNHNAYWSAYGKPDHEMRYLYDLTGYAKIEQIHMRYMDTATKNEVDELEKLLKDGVIF